MRNLVVEPRRLGRKVEPAAHSPPMTTPTFFEDAAFFRSWLEVNASSSAELLVGFGKVGCGLPSMSWPESVDEALCFGWIDGVRRRIDGASYSIRFTPRKSTSIWSAVNIAKVQQLRALGRMTPAGEQAFAQRKFGLLYFAPRTARLRVNSLCACVAV